MVKKSFLECSFLDCNHENVKRMFCFDCGYHIWTTDKEYRNDLRRRIDAKILREEIRRLEEVLLEGEQEK
jgi:hypothetical protein